MPIGKSTIRSTAQYDRDTNRSRRSSSKPSRPQADTNTIANAKRSYERYMTLARDAASTGDAVQTENLYQHAEHYLRQMKERAV